MKGKLYLADLITFCKMSGLVEEGRAVDVFYLDFSQAFSTVFHNIVTDKLTKYGLAKWTVRQTETSAILRFWEHLGSAIAVLIPDSCSLQMLLFELAVYHVAHPGSHPKA